MKYLEHRIRNLLSDARQLEIKVAQHQINWGEWESKKRKKTIHLNTYLTEMMSLLARFKKYYNLSI